jgi:hypothetical protein
MRRRTVRLNIAEIELSVLGRQAPAQWVGSREQLASAVSSWSSCRPAEQKGAGWPFRTEEARIKSAWLYPTVIT